VPQKDSEPGGQITPDLPGKAPATAPETNKAPGYLAGVDVPAPGANPAPKDSKPPIDDHAGISVSPDAQRDEQPGCEIPFE
jgi:hypothetical protein